MLIYNFQKEFLGIDAKDLQELGYHDLSALRSEVTDFADLFVKTPGFIHNFQHVHWIDFIDCADDGEIQKVIINANGKNFTANLVITYAYLTDNPIEKAFLIHLHNLRVLSDSEVEHIHDDILQRTIPTPPTPPTSFVEPTTPTEPVFKTREEPKQDLLAPQEEPTLTAEPLIQTQTAPQEETPVFETPAAVEDIYDTSDVKLDIEIEETPIETEPAEISQVLHPKHTIHKKEKFDNGYIYNPEVASKELGLPLDLIEEFIQDFIAQAGDFKPELYASLNDGDIDNVKTLSHKLKGVAANLRIEDAFEVLAIINTTSDITVIKTNLELFYKIISKLAGEEIDKIVEEEPQTAVDDFDEPSDIDLTFKEETQEKEKIQENVTLQDTPEEEFSLEFKEEEKIEIEPEPELSLEFKDEERQESDDDFALSFKEDETIQNEITQDTQVKETLSVAPEPEPAPIKVEYSKEKIANEIGLDITSFNELFEDYIQESNLLVDEMRDAADNGNFDLLKSEIMKLKGMSDNMRINSFNSELDALMHSTDKEESAQLIDSIKLILNQLSKAGA